MCTRFWQGMSLLILHDSQASLRLITGNARVGQLELVNLFSMWETFPI